MKKSTPSKKLKTRIQNFFEESSLDGENVTLFISHEASRSGAPLIIKNIAQDLPKEQNAKAVFLLCLGGELEDEFQLIGPSYLLSKWDHHKPIAEEIEFFLSTLSSLCNIKCIYVNSAESRFVLPYCRKHTQKLISLVHEVGEYYEDNAWKIIDDYSDLVVFPSLFVRKKAFLNYTFQKAKIEVYGQGLLKEEILDKYNEKDVYRSQIRHDLDIPTDSKIVLGCGTPIARKGIDYFVLIAINYLQKHKVKDVYFIWLGSGKPNDYIDWVDFDIEHSGLQAHIRFIGDRSNTIPWFLGSDLFFLCSRGDPYPCVVHEAIAAGLVTMVFKDSTGVEELLEDHRGHVLEFGNVIQSVETIQSYIIDPEKLSTVSKKNHLFAKSKLRFADYSKLIYEL